MVEKSNKSVIENVLNALVGQEGKVTSHFDTEKEKNTFYLYERELLESLIEQSKIPQLSNDVDAKAVKKYQKIISEQLNLKPIISSHIINNLAKIHLGYLEAPLDDDTIYLGNHIVSGRMHDFFDRYYEKFEDVFASTDKASFTISAIQDYLISGTVQSLQVDNAFYSPKTLKNTEEALNLYYKYLNLEEIKPS